MSTISPAERELLNRYNSDRNSEDINKVLSIPEDESTGSNMGSPDSVKSRTEDGNDRLDASEHKEQSRAARGNNSGRRDSNEARILETPEGIIYGFVKDGIIYLEPSLINPDTAIHEYTHLWDLMNETDLGELSEGNREYSIIKGTEGKELAKAVNQKNLVYKSGLPLDYINVGNRIYLYENPNYNNYTAYSYEEINVIFALEIDVYRDLQEIPELVDIIYGNSNAPSKNDLHDASQEQ